MRMRVNTPMSSWVLGEGLFVVLPTCALNISTCVNGGMSDRVQTHVDLGSEYPHRCKLNLPNVTCENLEMQIPIMGRQIICDTITHKALWQG